MTLGIGISRAFGSGTGFGGATGGSIFGASTPAFGIAGGLSDFLDNRPHSARGLIFSAVLGSPTGCCLGLELYLRPGGGIVRFYQFKIFVLRSAGSSPSMFGSSTPQLGGGLLGGTPTFGQTGGASPFGASPSPFGQSTPSMFGQPQQSASQQGSIFGQSPAFGQTQPSPFGQPQAQQQQQQSPFGQSFGRSPSMFGSPQQQMFQTPHLTTQMAPVAPLVIPLPDREIQVS